MCDALFNREVSPAALMSVREVVGAFARTRGSGQFSDKFGHKNCIILAIHANPSTFHQSS
jgi:hypothetical protein